ncbi:uncharacterized protein VTP21DRAFT_1646 [Calcarisporiella thermophila]|uniref:uncharacterized protein n=1 Tax=Calcarisporiella thermophila TaxID=911321 RepID=UPI0037444DCD
MMKLFLGKRAQHDTGKAAILRIKETIVMLEKREKLIRERAENEHKKAKSLATKSRKAALSALQRRNCFLDQIERIGLQYVNLEKQIVALESAMANIETLNAMRSGAESLRNIYGKMNVEKVDELMDDIRDQVDMNEEISMATTQSLWSTQDDEELLKELDDLLQEELNENMLSTPQPDTLHSRVSEQEPKWNQEDTEEKKTLRVLQSTMEEPL